MKRLLIILLVLITALHAHAQYKKIDSLKKLVAVSKSDTTTILLTDELAHCYLYYKPDSTLLLAKISLSLAKKVKFIKGEGRSYKQLGDALEQMGNYPGAMNAYLQHLHIAQQL